MQPFLSVVILAGGQSSRMGRDKATIEIDGLPILRWVYNAVADCREVSVGRIYVMTPWADRYRSILPSTCQFLTEPQPSQGPFLAFARALERIESMWLLVLACDLPNLSAAVIQAGIDGLLQVPAESVAYLPKHPEKGWESLCGFYRRDCQASALAYIDGGGSSFWGWLKTQMVVELEVVDPHCLLNCNTPADLDEIVDRRSSMWRSGIDRSKI